MIQPDLDSEEYVEETVAAYDLAAERYARRYAEVDLAEYIERFLSQLPITTGPVLDAGCGPGRDLVRFARLGVTAVGLDRSRGMLAIARRNDSTARLVQGDLRCLPFRDNAFAGTWSCASLLHLPSAGAHEALREVHRVLQPGAVLFLSVAHGAGSEWRAGSVGGRRWFQYYDHPTIEALVRAARFDVTWSAIQPGVVRGTWINLLARRQS